MTLPAIKENERLIFRGRLFPEGAPTEIEVAGGCIAEVKTMDSWSEPPGGQRWLAPGFFDIQINGFMGKEFCASDLKVEDVAHIARAVLRTGVTHFLPTVITNAPEILRHQVAVLAEAMQRDPLVAQMCPGLHVEGPFINPEDGPRGAHPRAQVRPPSVTEFERLQEAARGKIALLTLAPEQSGAEALIRWAASKKVVVSLGHHNADGPAIAAAVTAGARLCTHLGNGSHAVLPRLNNYIWHQLAEDRLWASFISDGHHIPPATLTCMFRVKTPARSILITDAMLAAGLPPGQYMLGQSKVELTAENKVVLPGTPYLAGSAADMPRIISHAVTDGEVSLADALRMAAINPRTLLAHCVPPWSCGPGQPADLVELDWPAAGGRLTVRQVAAGRFSARVNP